MRAAIAALGVLTLWALTAQAQVRDPADRPPPPGASKKKRKPPSGPPPPAPQQPAPAQPPPGPAAPPSAPVEVAPAPPAGPAQGAPAQAPQVPEAEPSGAPPSQPQPQPDATTAAPALAPEVPEEPPPPPDPDAPTAEAARPEEQAPRKAVIIVPLPKDEGRTDLIDGRVRQGAWLSGPGSLTFILQHTAMASLGGLLISGHAFRFGAEPGAAEAMLTGTLLGAGLGFATSAWWQHHHWIGETTSYFSIANAVIAGMFTVGLVDAFTPNGLALSIAALIGMEVGAWATTFLGGGDLRFDDGVFISAGAAWGLAYGSMLLAVIASSGTQISPKGVLDALLIAPGAGAGILALASSRYKPSASQVIRASLIGAGVGGAVLLLSGAVLGGFGNPTPYVLSMASAASAKAAVALLWPDPVALGRRDEPYRLSWW